MEANMVPKSMRNGIQRLPKKSSKKGYPEIAKMCAQGSPTDPQYSYKCDIFWPFRDSVLRWLPGRSGTALGPHLDSILVAFLINF